MPATPSAGRRMDVGDRGGRWRITFWTFYPIYQLDLLCSCVYISSASTKRYVCFVSLCCVVYIPLVGNAAAVNVNWKKGREGGREKGRKTGVICAMY